MFVYIVTTVISIIFAYLLILYKRNSSNRIVYNTICILSFLPLFIVSSIRYNVGTDYSLIYKRGFNIILNHSKEFINFEIGYILLNKFIILFTDNYIWIFVLTSFIFCFFIYKSIFEQSVNSCYSILLFLITGSYLISFNAVRQSIAISMFMYGIKYIKSRSPIKYFLIIILASTIHKSILLFLPIYFFKYIKFKPSIGYILMGLSVLSLPVAKGIIFWVISVTKYSTYIGSKFDTGNFEVCYFLMHLCIIMYLYIFYKKYKNDEEYILFLNMELSAFVLSVYSSFFPLATRLLWGFAFPLIIFIPKISCYLKGYEKLFLNIFIIILLILYMFYTFAFLGAHEVLPYATLWS